MRWGGGGCRVRTGVELQTNEAVELQAKEQATSRARAGNGKGKNNRRSFDSALRASLRMTISWAVGGWVRGSSCGGGHLNRYERQGSEGRVEVVGAGPV